MVLFAFENWTWYDYQLYLMISSKEAVLIYQRKKIQGVPKKTFKEF